MIVYCDAPPPVDLAIRDAPMTPRIAPTDALTIQSPMLMRLVCAGVSSSAEMGVCQNMTPIPVYRMTNRANIGRARGEVGLIGFTVSPCRFGTV